MTSTSFMSEHTAEYSLVPNITDQLGKHYSRAIPVYFWATREGSRVGRKSGNNHLFQLVACYARRPKVTNPGDERIIVKVNEIIFAAARAGAEVGIPVLAGVPLVSNLLDYSVSSPCAWFHILGESRYTHDYEFPLALSEQLQRPDLVHDVVGPLAPQALVQLTEANCRQLDWAQITDAIRHIKSAGGSRHPFFGAAYRPFLVLMH